MKLIAENGAWLGHSIHSGDREFFVPHFAEIQQENICRIDEDGYRYIRINPVRWFTNIDCGIRPAAFPLTESYSPERYPAFDYYPAINVDVTKEIPSDYYELMGVPITFLDKYCPTQFQIIDCLNAYAQLDALGLNKKIREENGYASMVNGKAKYARIIIKRKQS